MSNKPIRHGELMLVPTARIVKGQISAVQSRILAHSETGHHHVLEATTPFEVITDPDNNVFVRLMTGATLVHQKEFDRHANLAVAPGTYEVIHKTEYDPFEKVIRQVAD